jgi:hypothetical protein
MARIPNGRSKGHRASEFDPVQLHCGTVVEREHTTSNTIAKRIAMDHLTEDPRYYTKLARFDVDARRCLIRVKRR